MKETTFIENNKKKWREFEKLSTNKNEDPDKLSELFVELTEDLSYAKTFYPKRSVRVYLNYLAQKVYVSFNKPKRNFLSTFLNFWRERLPLEMYKGRKELLIAFLFFSGAVLIGAVSSHIDPEFSRVILGDRYVNMTEANINSGDPMAIYKDMDETEMFLYITINNIQVAFFAFILGIFFSVGTIFLLVSNGVMLGAFQYFFYIKGLFLTSFLTIWIHGTLEISVIIIAGAAGIVMGNGLLFPKTLTRTQSLQITARRGMNMLLGTIPVFVIAGFLEGFVTRHTEMPDVVKWLIILSSLSFILIYYVFYPRKVAKRVKFDGTVEEKPVHIEKVKLKKYAIRDFGQIFYDSFKFYRTYSRYFGKVIGFINLPLILIYLGFLYNSSQYADFMLAESDIFRLTHNAGEFFNWIGFGFVVLILSINVSTIIHCMKFVEQNPPKKYLKIWVREIWPLLLKSIIVIAPVIGLFCYLPGWIVLIFFFIAPFVFMTFFPAISGEYKFFAGIGKGIKYAAKDWGLIFISILMMFALTYIFTWIYHNPFLQGLDIKTAVVDEIVKWHTITVFDNFITIKNFISSLFVLIIIQYLLPLLISSFCFQFFSVKDKEEAIGLNARFEEFAKKNKHYETN